MPALNMGLRQKVADMVVAGFDDKEIRRECHTAQYMVAPLRRIVELGLPLNTRIRRDGSIGAGPRYPVLTEEERRSRKLEYHREWDRKHRVRKKPAFEFTEESDGALNITLVVAEPIPKPRNEKPKAEKIIDHTGLILSEARDFQSAWRIKLKQDEWLVSDPQAVIEELSTLRTLTTRMINKVKEKSK